MRAAALALALVIAVAGCGDAPTTRDLFGLWLHTGDGVNRSYEFAAKSDAHPELAGKVLVYLLRRYPVGQTSAVVEVGVFDVAPTGGDATDMTTTVLWDETGSRTGGTFAYRLEDFDDEHLTLREADGSAVRYLRVDALP